MLQRTGKRYCVCCIPQSYAPLLFLGAGGSALDVMHGYSSCNEQREALAEHQRRLETAGKEGWTP